MYTMETLTSISVSADVKKLVEIRQFVREELMSHNLDPIVISDVVLAVDEAVTNIIIHGYRGQMGIIKVILEIEDDRLIVRLRDQAPAYDPLNTPVPDLSVPLVQRSLGGLGVFLIKQLMDDVTHLISPQGGNELIMVKEGIRNSRM